MMRGTTVLFLSSLMVVMTMASAAEYEVVLEDFSSPKLSWSTFGDDHMGGPSHGDFRIGNGVGVYDGRVGFLPRIAGPGFIKLDGSSSFDDISTCRAIKLVARSTTPSYQGFRLSFGTEHDPVTQMPYIKGHKAHFYLDASVPSTGFQTVLIPFHDFSLDWDPRTGDAVVPCRDDVEFCPDLATLQDIKKLAILGEGAAGDVNLEMQTISAVECGQEPMNFMNFPKDVQFVEYEYTAEGRSFFGVPFFLMAAAAIVGALYWKQKKQQRTAPNFYQAVETIDTTPHEAGYSLELAET
ncbi:expressed unknown protein [Seminavis robusta]|uniref:NADH:ubiquinone oxidoreductase intermediate-associated protein 30 domain-containing protein n=1 Tax=Seminavis robusta TaxID=568900 RepID=A0A9N8DIR6_9STRA|nr:expressed unknown protein [Seminavis robusta]|eukprot:Sro164_g073580.1 n/a (296) ;mRNA; r:37965-38852